MEEKIKITDEMLGSFMSMFNSNDVGDSKLALDILNNRDIEDTQTNANFEQIKNKIANTQTIFPWTQYSGHFVIKTYQGKIISLAQKSYDSDKSARNGLAYYLRQRMKWGGKEWVSIKNIFGDYKTLQKFLFDNKIIYVDQLR